MASLVDLGAWTAGRPDLLRRRRLAMGYVVGAGVSAGLIGAVIANSKALAAEREEEILNVQLATQPEPEPEPEPQPQARVVAKPPPRPRLQVPVEVPKEAPKEVDTAKAIPDRDPDPFAHQQEERPAPKPAVAIVKEEPKPVVRVAPPKPRGPIQITENVTPPEVVSTPQPIYPPAAKASGIQGTVVVRYVVTETGSVTNIEVVRGPAELRGAVLDAMRTWRFKPAVLDGRPVAVTRVKIFPFRIKI